MAENKMEAEEQASESVEEVKRKQIAFLKAVLRIYKARVLSLSSDYKSRVANIVIPDGTENVDFLREQINGLHNDITLMRAFQDCVEVIHNTVTYLNGRNLGNQALFRKLENVVSEISYFSKSIIRLYDEKVNESEILRNKEDYIMALTNYENNLESLIEKREKSPETAEELKRLQKAETQVYKINFIRKMKLILVSRFASNSDEYPTLQKFRSPCRKNLTVDDFTDTWDVGL